MPSKMMILRDIVMVVLFLALLFITPSTADIISLNMRSDRRHNILFSKFGFSHTGHLSIEISSVKVTSTSSQPNPSRIGFFLLPHQLVSNYYYDFQLNPNMCVLDNEYISVLFTFQDVYAHSNSSFNRSYPVSLSSPDVYILYFANCNRRSFVTMNVRLELYNTYNDTKDYLSAGLTYLPSLYLVFSVAYLCFLGFWIFVCLKNRHDFHTIHFVMGVLLVATIGYFIFATAYQRDLKATGSRDDDGWISAWFDIFQLIRFVLLFSVIGLIGTGWSLWNPFLRGKDKLFLTAVILLEVWANGDAISAGVDFVCCIVVFLWVAWSAASLRQTREDDEKSVEKETLEKLELFMPVVYVYVTFSRIIVGLLVATFVEYTAPLVTHAADETSGLVFCMVMFDLFRPCSRVKRQLPWYAKFLIDRSYPCKQDPERPIVSEL
ncbi:hypothetical protein LXL04_010563 [Taraxacum kok-saghyz]